MPAKRGGPIREAQAAAILAKRVRKEQKQHRDSQIVGLTVPSGVIRTIGTVYAEFDTSPLVTWVGEQFLAVRQSPNCPNEHTASPVLSGLLNRNDLLTRFASKKVQSKFSKVKVRSGDRAAARICSLAWCLDRFKRQLLVKTCASRPGFEIEHFGDAPAFDETPLPALQTESSSNSKLLTASRPGFTAALAAAADIRAAISQPRGALPTKILQTQSFWGMLLRFTEDEDALPCFVVGRTLSHLQKMQRYSTGQVLNALDKTQTGSSLEITAAKGHSRLPAIDRHPSNLQAERKGDRRRRRRFKNSQTYLAVCKMHILAGIEEDSMHVFNDTISGLIHTVLSINAPGRREIFTSCLREAFRERTIVKVGGASLARVARARIVTKWFIPKGGNDVLRRVLLDALITGGIEDEAIIILIQPGTEFDEEITKETAVETLASVCTTRIWSLYNRKIGLGTRWLYVMFAYRSCSEV